MSSECNITHEIMRSPDDAMPPWPVASTSTTQSWILQNRQCTASRATATTSLVFLPATAWTRGIPIDVLRSVLHLRGGLICRRGGGCISFHPISGKFLETTISVFKEHHIRLTKVIEIIVTRIPHAILRASSPTGAQPLALQTLLRQLSFP